jgi:transposase-like protein
MRHSPAAIRQFLTEQPLSGQTVVDFCEDNDLKAPTFYSWKRKYEQAETPALEGFCKITPKREAAERSLRLPSGLRLDLVGLSTTEIVELILEIDRAYA